jgi:hypothetical protein
VDIQKLKLNDKFRNYIFSTCPIIPRFHLVFGEPLDRQEVSAELEIAKSSDNKKEEGKKLMGRVDDIYYSDKLGMYLVKDDFGIHLMYDSSLLDMCAFEEEALRICSFYLAKQEPVLDYELKNIFPIVDRLEMLEEIFECELAF